MAKFDELREEGDVLPTAVLTLDGELINSIKYLRRLDFQVAPSLFLYSYKRAEREEVANLPS